MNKRNLISNIDHSKDIPNLAMYDAIFKKDNNRILEMLNDLITDNNKKIKIIPLTEEENKLCEQFEQFVKFTKEPTQ